MELTSISFHKQSRFMPRNDPIKLAKMTDGELTQAELTSAETTKGQNDSQPNQLVHGKTYCGKKYFQIFHPPCRYRDCQPVNTTLESILDFPTRVT